MHRPYGFWSLVQYWKFSTGPADLVPAQGLDFEAGIRGNADHLSTCWAGTIILSGRSIARPHAPWGIGQSHCQKDGRNTMSVISEIHAPAAQNPAICMDSVLVAD